MRNPTTPTPAGTPSNTAIAADATDLNNRWPSSRVTVDLAEDVQLPPGIRS